MATPWNQEEITTNPRRRLTLLCTAFLAVSTGFFVPATAGAGEELRGVPDLRFRPADMARRAGEGVRMGRIFLQMVHPTSRRRRFRAARRRLDLTPVLLGIADLVRDAGIPLRDYGQRRDGSPMGVSASFRLNHAMPAVNFHVGESAAEPLGAFYSADGDVSWAFSIPVRQFTLRLEGGDRSEFGYYAIAGTHWQHPTQPLAIGVGIPMQLGRAPGSLGMVVLLRMRLP